MQDHDYLAIINLQAQIIENQDKLDKKHQQIHTYRTEKSRKLALQLRGVKSEKK